MTTVQARTEGWVQNKRCNGMSRMRHVRMFRANASPWCKEERKGREEGGANGRRKR